MSLSLIAVGALLKVGSILKNQCPAQALKKYRYSVMFIENIFFFYNFIYFWLHWTFIAVQGLSLVVVLRFLTVVASLVAELRL